MNIHQHITQSSTVCTTASELTVYTTAASVRDFDVDAIELCGGPLDATDAIADGVEFEPRRKAVLPRFVLFDR
ncbi:MAG: hypothetical protein E6Q97_22170 [Desulfurellales bacterium]|nr:MAG: hypothetical protein E6Q97_22170 [Desulfurellales bacterium]